MQPNAVGQVIKCRAAVAWEERKALSIEEIEVAPPHGRQVRVKILYCSLCNLDIFFDDGSVGDIFPCILGHEAVGIVESVGDEVTDLAAGDTVLSLCVPQCKKCVFCLNQATNVCEKFCLLKSPKNSDGLSCKKIALKQIFGCGTLSEYTLIDDISLAKIPNDAPLEKISFLACSFAAGYGAPLRTCKVEPGSSVAVFGLSAVGLAAILGAKAAGARTIVAVDNGSRNFERAKTCGATACVDNREMKEKQTIQSYLAAKFNGGLDYVFECTGDPFILREAFESTKKEWGTTCAIGLSEKELSLHPHDLICGRTLKGCLFGGWKGRDDMPKLLADYTNGTVQFHEFVTDKFYFTDNDLDQAVNLLRLKMCICPVIKIGH